MKEKPKDFRIRLVIALMAFILVAELIIFAVIAMKEQDLAGKEKISASVKVIKNKKAAPVEMKQLISKDLSAENSSDEAPQEPKDPENTPKEQNPNSGDMTAKLQEQIQSMISSQYTAGGNVAVSAGRIADGTLALVNDQSMQAASLIKLFVAGCVYETMENSDQYEGQISSMISVSDNSACNSLVSTLGGGDAQAGMAKVNEYCMNHGFTETHMGRLMLQPNDVDDNYTSVSDCGNFLLNIYNGNLAGSAQILEYMKQQERRGKIPAGVPDGVQTANKTGELDFVENDAAIIFHPSGPYILCVMSENLNDAYTARLFINSLSEMVYGLME